MTTALQKGLMPPLSERPLIDRARTKPKFRPFSALRHMRALLADNEDTEQVFHIMECLNGGRVFRLLKAFAETPAGRARLNAQADLPKLLDNHQRWLALPHGTVGRAYVDFMRREGLSAAGLVAESEKWLSTKAQLDDDMDYFTCLLRDTHDLMHVLTGYGRDPLGEACVLAFTHGQNGGFGHLFIAYIAGWDLMKRSPKQARIMTCINEARRHGRKSARLIARDVESLMHEPLSYIRTSMNIPEPSAYKCALSHLKAVGYEGQIAA